MVEHKIVIPPEQRMISLLQMACCSQFSPIDAYICTPVTSVAGLSAALSLEERIQVHRTNAISELKMLQESGKLSYEHIYFPHSLGIRYDENGEMWKESKYLLLSAKLLLGIPDEQAKSFFSSILLSPQMQEVMNNYHAPEKERKEGYIFMAERIAKVASSMKVQPRDVIKISTAPTSLGCGAELYLAAVFANRVISLT